MQHCDMEITMKYSIPLAIQFVIDDVGWWSGDDDSATQGPYRTGFVRQHHPADYQAIVNTDWDIQRLFLVKQKSERERSTYHFEPSLTVRIYR